MIARNGCSEAWGIDASAHRPQQLSLGLIRFGGHLPKGGYDVLNGGNTKPTAPSAV